MGHIALKRAKFKKGNFKINRNEFYVFGRLHGYYVPSKSYRHAHCSYYYPTKVTEFERKSGEYMYKKTIKNWLN